MRKFWYNLLWVIAVPWVVLLLINNVRLLRKKGLKYRKYPDSIDEEERYKLVGKTVDRALYMMRFKVKSEGFVNLPNKPMLLILNHKSNLDPLILIKVLHEWNKKNNFGIYYTLIAKHTLQQKNNFITKAMDLIDSLYLERENVRQSLEVYKKQIEMVSKKKSIAIFIEGTRIYEDTFGEFKHAALKIAYHSYLPILPIVIFGSSGLVDSNKTNVKKGKTVYIKSLDIIQPKTFLDRDSKLFCDELKEKMQKQYDKMNENYNNKKPIFIEQK